MYVRRTFLGVPHAFVLSSCSLDFIANIAASRSLVRKHVANILEERHRLHPQQPYVVLARLSKRKFIVEDCTIGTRGLQAMLDQLTRPSSDCKPSRGRQVSDFTTKTKDTKGNPAPIQWSIATLPRDKVKIILQEEQELLPRNTAPDLISKCPMPTSVEEKESPKFN